MPVTKSQEAYDHLRFRICTGSLSPGHHLAEPALAEELKMSRAPLREALRRLVNDGLVEQVPGLGAFVRLPEPEELAEICEARGVLETFTARRAAESIRVDQLRHLDRLCEQMHALASGRNRQAWDAEQRAEMLEIELGFHLSIARVAGNATIARLIEDFLTVQFIVTYHPEVVESSSLDTRKHAWERHVKLVEALRRHDPDAAAESVRIHIQAGADTAIAACRTLRGLASATSRAGSVPRVGGDCRIG